MLVLSRITNEEVYVYTPAGMVRVMVVDVQGNKVRLGFDAPDEISIHRREVAEEIEANGKDPSKSNVGR